MAPNQPQTITKIRNYFKKLIITGSLAVMQSCSLAVGLLGV